MLECICLVTYCVSLCDWQTNSDPPHLAAYTSYIDHEIKERDPVRVLCIFERAIVDNCLKPDLWIRYINYVVYILFCLFYSSLLMFAIIIVILFAQSEQ